MNSNQEAAYDDFENNPNVKALQEFRRKAFEIQGAAGGKTAHQKEEIKCREKEIRKNGYRSNDTTARGSSRKTP